MTILDPMIWMSGSFFQRPERRWLRANDLAARGKPCSRRFDDEWTGEIRAAVSGHKRSRRITAIWHALSIWQAKDRRVRWELEARLLAGQSDDEIAVAMTLSAAIVEAFHETFYCVRPRRQYRDWVTLQALGGLPHRNFAGAEQPGTLLRFMAYIGGPTALEVAMAVIYETPLPPDVIRSTGAEGLREEAEVRLKALAYFQLLTAQTEAESAAAMTMYEQATASTTSSRKSSEGWLSVMAEFLREVLAKARPTSASSSLSKTKATAKPNSKALKPRTTHDAKEVQDGPQDDAAEATAGKRLHPANASLTAAPPASHRRTIRRLPVGGEPPAGSEYGHTIGVGADAESAASEEPADRLRSGDDWHAILPRDDAQHAQRPHRRPD